jgi:two-component sensor histidine kinase
VVSFQAEKTNNFEKRGLCSLIRENNINNIIKNKLLFNDLFQICNNGNMGLHMQYPVIIDNKFIGLLLSGTMRFQYPYDIKLIQEDLKNLQLVTDNKIDILLEKYKITWFDSEYRQGIDLTKEVLVEKISTFRITSENLVQLLNEKYLGKIRKNNRESIREIFSKISPDIQQKGNEFSEESYRDNLNSVIELFSSRILPCNNIIVYDNFIVKTGVKIFSTKDIYLNPISESELILNNEIFDTYFEKEQNYIWVKGDNNIDDVLFRKTHEYLFEQLKIQPGFLLFIPITVQKSEKKRVFILFYGHSKNYPYNSENFKYYLWRLFDILKYSLQNYYNQIQKEKYLIKTTHDIKKISGDIYTRANDIERDFNYDRIHFSEIIKKISNTRKSSEKLIEISDSLYRLAENKYEEFELFEWSETNFYKEIFLEIFNNNLTKINSLGIMVDYSKLHNAPMIITRAHTLYRVFENMFINAIKYSIPFTEMSIGWKREKQNIVIELINVSVKLNDNEINRIVEQNFQGSNVKIFKEQLEKLGYPDGKGLGLNIVYDLLENLHGKLRIQQETLTLSDREKISLTPEFDVNKCCRFKAQIDLVIKKEISDANSII